MHTIVETAFRTLYPNKPFNYQLEIKYTGKFKPYGANVRKRGNQLEFHFCNKWKNIDESIVTGLIQELFCKLFNDPKESINIDLYNRFVQNLHLSIPKTQSHPLLEASFQRNNAQYFENRLEQPNLVIGQPSRTKLGSYDFKTDTITISSLFVEHPRAMDYIMYHEMLHKDLKYVDRPGRNVHHSAEFRRREKLFENSEEMERLLQNIIRNSRKQGRKQRGILQSLLDGFF